MQFACGTGAGGVSPLAQKFFFLKAIHRRIAAEVERLKALPDGVTVYPVVVLPTDKRKAKVERSLSFVVHYATINRHAFVPTLYAIKGQQPLLFRTEPHPHPTLTITTAQQWLEFLASNDVWLGYDYVWSYGVSGGIEELLQTKSTVVTRADGFALWRVNSKAGK